MIDFINCLFYSEVEPEIHPPTPAKYKQMPQTVEYLQKQLDREHKLILEMKNEISILKIKLNKAEQKAMRARNRN